MKRFSWSILMILPLGALAADVYRSIDENGQIIYSDRPSDTAELVAVSRSVSISQQSAAAQADNSDEDESESDLPPGAEIPREGTPEEIASDRARNCEYARQMAETYSNSRRLFTTGADGERVYLSGTEIDERRATAESNVATWCD